MTIKFPFLLLSSREETIERARTKKGNMNPQNAAPPPERGPVLRRTGVKGPARRVPRSEQTQESERISQLEEQILLLMQRVVALEQRAAIVENHVEGIDNDLGELIPRVAAIEADRGFTEINEIDAAI